jgi:AcrR family transcriptional regulator
VGEATIYNYFPTKEAIIYAYYEDHMLACIEALKQVESFHTFSLQEQLQTLFDASLNLYLPDREFVSQTVGLVLTGGSSDWSRVKPIRAVFLSAVDDMLEAACEVDEIPEPLFQELISQFFVDAYFGVVHYWLADTSDIMALLQNGSVDVSFIGGAQIDRFGNLNTSYIGGSAAADTRLPGSGGACDLACAFLKAGIANKIFDMALFLFKTHVLTRLDRVMAPISAAGKVKRRFMEALDEK